MSAWRLEVCEAIDVGLPARRRGTSERLQCQLEGKVEARERNRWAVESKRELGFGGCQDLHSRVQVRAGCSATTCLSICETCGPGSEHPRSRSGTWRSRPTASGPARPAGNEWSGD